MALPKQARPVGGSPHVKMMVYGNPGVGKTRLLGSHVGRTLIIRPPTDHTESIRSAEGSTVREWIVKDWSDMTDVLEYLRHDGAKDWDWVWLDSISLMQDHGLDDVWADTLARKPERGKFGLDKQEYGINFFRLGAWVRHFVGTGGFNVGITAHPRELGDEDGNPVLMPWVQGKNMANKICGYMNVVAYLRKRTVKGDSYRELITDYKTSNNHIDIYAKDQLDAFGGSVREPTMSMLMEKIKNSRGLNQPVRDLVRPQPPRRRPRPAVSK